MTEARRYGGQSAAERDDARRTRLREAALELFGTQGYAGVSIDRLCSAAKVSTRHFYQLHSNKEDMLLDLYASLTTGSLEDVVASLRRNEGETIAVRLRDAVGAYLRPLLADPRKARIAFVEIVGVSGRVEERRLQFRNGIIALVEAETTEAIERGELTRTSDIRFRALAMVGAANVIVHDWSIHPGRRSAGALEKAFCDLAVELVVGRVDAI
ncbi:TetR/AcrR family transcriptional regulator [Nocardioides antri]|uniref:TetR/AcrR family transcriptional regulator n=1 Tax=Nocardioides antri TaxID=2607659 RepID=UPI00165F7367|nr:TetR/AcrR family transcriptional regulator [Nocardioides antri]